MLEMNLLPDWYEKVRLHSDVDSGSFSRATFAIDFGAVVSNSPNVPAVYRDASSFWPATYLTRELNRLLDEILGCLAGKPGDRVIQMRSPFGGGKSHVLTALYHAAGSRKALDQSVPAAKKLPDPGKVRVAGLDGEKFGPQEGSIFNGITAHTLWGALAAQLGVFDMVSEHEQKRTAPGGDLVSRMLGDVPTLILMDEVLSYVEKALTIGVGESNLGRQTLNFLQTLTIEIAGSSHAAVVYSLQASSREAFDNVGLLNTLDHLAARVDAKREPVVGDEILEVLRKRLLAEMPADSDARQAAKAISRVVSQWQTAEALDAASRRMAQDDEIKFARRLESAYPFHIDLIEIMKTRWASLPNFQRTRGALRFLATVLYKCKKLNRHSPVVGPGDIPLDDPDVRNAFFAEVIAEAGQRDQYHSVLEHDFIGGNSRVKRIDTRLIKENPALSNIQPAMRLATAIMMYSFGGVQREQGSETLPPGVSEKELIEASLLPGLDSITAQSVLKRLRDELLFLHYDGIRYCFKTQANVNKLLEDEVDSVRPDEVRRHIEVAIEERVGAVTNAAFIWPDKSEAIPDKEPRFLLAYLPLELSEKSRAEQEKVALNYLTNFGSEPRRYRNGVGLAIPEPREMEGIRRAARYLLAVDRVRKKQSSYKLGKDQMDQLKERESTEKAALEAGLRILYSSVWLLRVDGGKPALEKLEVGGRPVKAQSIHERLEELLIDVHGKLFTTLRPAKLMSLMLVGKGAGEHCQVETKVILDTFFGTPGFLRLKDANVLRDAIAQGISEGVIVYTLKNRIREDKGQYWVSVQDAVIGRRPGLDEIDLDSGIIMLPDCVSKDEPAGVPPVAPVPPGSPPPDGPEPEPPMPTPPRPGQSVKSLTLEMKLSKAMLFKTFNVLGLLADKAGEIKLEVHGENLDADPTWLRNAITEPLSEAGIEYKIKEEQETI